MQIEECNVSAALNVIGGKWKPLILWVLKQGSHRFSELRRKVPAASQKVMTEQLRQLERSGIVCSTGGVGRSASQAPHA